MKTMSDLGYQFVITVTWPADIVANPDDRGPYQVGYATMLDAEIGRCAYLEAGASVSEAQVLT